LNRKNQQQGIRSIKFVDKELFRILWNYGKYDRRIEKDKEEETRR
jgi:hypothetical protein